MDYDFGNEKIQIEKDGKTVDCDILFTFDCEQTMKSYIGYTDNSIADNGRKNIYVSSFDPLKPLMKLEDITDERGLEMIDDVLKQIENDSK